jgi:hypothetical protein
MTVSELWIALRDLPSEMQDKPVMVYVNGPLHGFLDVKGAYYDDVDWVSIEAKPQYETQAKGAAA